MWCNGLNLFLGSTEEKYQLKLQPNSPEENGVAPPVHDEQANDPEEPEGEEHQDCNEEDQPVLQVRHQQQLPAWKRVSACDSCVIGTFLFMLLACIGLVIYTGVMVHEVNSAINSDVWLSTTENFSLSDLTQGQLNWYTREICIKKLTPEDFDSFANDQVAISLIKKPCREVAIENTEREVVKNSIPYHGSKLSFFWFKGTKVIFKVTMNKTSNLTDSYFRVYIIHTDNEWIQCQRHTLHKKQSYQFNFNGESTNNVKCDEENLGFTCVSSKIYEIKSTQRYHVCIQFPAEGSTGHDMTFHVLTNGMGYHSGLCDGKMCHLNQTDCCISYDTFLNEMYVPTCAFIQSATPNSEYESNEMQVFLTITSTKRWDAVVYSAILGVVVLALLGLSIACVSGKIRYQKTHPNQHCMEIKIFGRNCLQL